MKVQAKEGVKRQKMEKKLQALFEKDLHKLYPVERKY